MKNRGFKERCENFIFRKFDSLVMRSFNRDGGFVASLDKACGRFKIKSILFKLVETKNLTSQYSTVQYSTVQYSTVQYNTVQNNTWLSLCFFQPHSCTNKY